MQMQGPGIVALLSCAAATTGWSATISATSSAGGVQQNAGANFWQVATRAYTAQITWGTGENFADGQRVSVETNFAPEFKFGIKSDPNGNDIAADRTWKGMNFQSGKGPLLSYDTAKGAGKGTAGNFTAWANWTLAVNLHFSRTL